MSSEIEIGSLYTRVVMDDVRIPLLLPREMQSPAKQLYTAVRSTAFKPLSERTRPQSEYHTLAASIESPLQQHLPVLSILLFLFFGWSTTKPTSAMAELWVRCCVPVSFIIYFSYIVLQCIKFGYGLPVSLTIGAPLCCTIVAPYIFYTFSSLAALGNILNETFTNPHLISTKKRIKRIEWAIWIAIIVFEAAAMFAAITNIRTPKTSLLVRIDDVLFLLYIFILGLAFVALAACYHIVITLHWAQTELLAFHWRRRSSSPLLLTDSYFAPKLNLWEAAFLNFVAFSAQDPLAACMRPVLPLVETPTSEDLPLSTIVAQFMLVRRSVAQSICAWQFIVTIMLYMSFAYTLFFSYENLVLRNNTGVPFTFLQPIINALLLLPLAQLNSNWVTMSKSQLDYNTSRYSTEEQLLLLQLQMKQSLSKFGG